MAMEEWAKKELDRLIDKNNNCDMQKMMNKQIMEMVKLFCSHGHSGFSASYALNLLKNLLAWKPITPLTGEEIEWNQSVIDPNGTEQNNRCSAVFRKNKDNSTAYYIDGKSFSDDGGHTFYKSSKSSVPVVFPYVIPETEYIYVTDDGEETVITDKEEIKRLYDKHAERYKD